MQITRTLSITAEEFFDQIEQSILADIKEATGKDISRAKLNGFKYKKRARGGGKGGTPMDVKVKHYRYPELYEVRFTYATGVNTLRYQVIEVGDGSLTIEYAEELEARGGSDKGIRGTINRKLYDARIRRRAVKTLKAIEEMAVRDRKARENNPKLAELEVGPEADTEDEEQAE